MCHFTSVEEQPRSVIKAKTQLRLCAAKVAQNTIEGRSGFDIALLPDPGDPP